MKATLTVVALVIAGVAFGARSVEQARRLRLPDIAYNYADIRLPPHFDGAHAVDNTPADNPITNDGATLGRVLFYDTALSANGTTSCASCHRQEHAFADPNRFSRGFDGHVTDRHAMNLTALRYYPSGRFFWDERAANLEGAVLLPIRDPIEMGQDLAELPRKLSEVPYYPALFRRAFSDSAITEARIGRALAQFLRSMVSYRSRFDDGMARARSDEDDFENFTRQENRGKALFLRNCLACHHVVQESPFTLVSPRNIGTELDPVSGDGGLADITLNAYDAGLFKAPTLRNVEVAGPYMHNGSLATLDDVMEHYSGSFKSHPNLDVRIAPLRLTMSEKAAIVAFLKTLTDRAFLADPRFADPFDPPLARAQRAAPFAPPPGATTSSERGDAETVVARVMSFDTNGDQRVAGSELPDRMREVVKRGDRNGDSAIDREEIRAIASSSNEVGVGVGISLRSPREVRIRFRPVRFPSVAGLIDDLKLPPERRSAALAAIAQAEAVMTAALAASIETFRAETRALVTAEQFAALDPRIQDYGNVLRQFLGAMDGPGTAPIPSVDLDRWGRSSGFTDEVLASVKSAVDRHLERTFGVATDLSELLRRLTPVLTREELADFAASLERHRTILTRAGPAPR